MLEGLTSDQRTLIAIVICAIVVALVAFSAFRRIRRDRVEPPRRVEIARIHEEFVETPGAGFFVLMLIATQVWSAYKILTAANAIQEIAAAAIWIGGTLVWGGAVALARRRIYVVMRELPPEEQPIASGLTAVDRRRFK